MGNACFIEKEKINLHKCIINGYFFKIVTTSSSSRT